MLTKSDTAMQEPFQVTSMAVLCLYKGGFSVLLLLHFFMFFLKLFHLFRSHFIGLISALFHEIVMNVVDNIVIFVIGFFVSCHNHVDNLGTKEFILSWGQEAHNMFCSQLYLA